MAHGIGDIKAQVVLIESKRVVEIASDAAGRQIEHGQLRPRHFRHGLRKKALLNATRQLQLLIHFSMGCLEPLIDLMRLGGLVHEPIVQLLDPQQSLGLSQQDLRSKWPREIGIHARFHAVQGRRRLALAHDVKDRNERIAQFQPQPIAELQILRSPAFHEDQVLLLQLFRIGRSQAMRGNSKARVLKELARVVTFSQLIPAPEDPRCGHAAH